MAKALSLKLDDPTYLAAEKIRKRLKVPRNTYLRKAISHYNALYSRKLLEQEYRKASRRLGASPSATRAEWCTRTRTGSLSEMFDSHSVVRPAGLASDGPHHAQ